MSGEAVAFWSIIVPGGKDVQQEIESTDHVLSTIHVTGMALGAGPAKGPHCVLLEYNGVNTVLATLEDPHTRQYHLDIVVDQTAKFVNNGRSPVHLYGYHVSTPMRSEDEDDDEEGEEGEGEEEEGEEEEGEEDPEQLAALKRIHDAFKARAERREAAKAAAAQGGKPNGTAPMAMGADDDEDDDEDEGDEGEDEDDDEIPSAGELGSDDMIGEAESDDGEDEEDEDEDEEPQAPPAKVGGKRGAQTPQPSKPSKQARQEAPATAPPKQGGKAKADDKAAPAGKGIATPSTEAEYKAALVAHLRKAKGPVQVSLLGSAIRKPDAVTKVSAWVAAHKDTFVYDASKQTVALKK